MKLTVLCPLQEEDKQRILAAAPNDEVLFTTNAAITPEQCAEADVVFGNIAPAKLEQYTNLKWLQLISAGADAYTSGGLLRPDVILTSSSGSYGQMISEYLLCAVMTHLQNFHRLRDNQNARLWKEEGLSKSIQGAAVAVFGVGDIGENFAKRVKLLGAAKVFGFRRTLGATSEWVDEMHTLDQMCQVLPQADIVVSVLPDNEATRGIFNRETFACFKKGAVFVNAGRGSAVDLDALCDAVESGALRGATVDVVPEEPLPADHRAWGITNLVVTPHVAGGFRVSHGTCSSECLSMRLIISHFLENLAHYQKGEPLAHVVAHS